MGQTVEVDNAPASMAVNSNPGSMVNGIKKMTYIFVHSGMNCASSYVPVGETMPHP